VLSRETAEFGESPVEVVDDTLAEHPSEYLRATWSRVSSGGKGGHGLRLPVVSPSVKVRTSRPWSSNPRGRGLLGNSWPPGGRAGCALPASRGRQCTEDCVTWPDGAAGVPSAELLLGHREILARFPGEVPG
jgi:hypothetical protein